MVTVDTKHNLLSKEVLILKQLIGKTLTEIHSSRVDFSIQNNVINLVDPINLKFKGMTDFITISADFDETKFGDDFIKINIEQNIELIGINRSEQIGQKLPPFDMNIFPEFKILKIEVYGSSYTCESENTNPKSYWKIEIDNPGHHIIENIETECTLLFHSDNKRLLIKPWGPVPFISITFDDESIDQLIVDKDLEGKPTTRKKHEI